MHEEIRTHESAEGSVAPKTLALPPQHSLVTLLGDQVQNDEALQMGLTNLASLPEIAGGQNRVKPYRNRPVKEGVMGFRREGGSLELTVACDTAQVQKIPLGKFVALVEQIYNHDRGSIVLKNHMEPGHNTAGRGQSLGRIIPGCSALVIGLGFVGRVIAKPDDFVKLDVYYLSRATLTAFYLAAKMQLSTEDHLNELINAYEGWYKFDIPLDQNNPYALA